jgi:hypothetical protein
MSEEYENEVICSPFWPLLILLVGLLCWCGYQVYAENSQRVLNTAQVAATEPTVKAAQDVANRYVALMNDLLQTSQKDPVAKQIVNDAIQVGLLRVDNSGAATTNGTTTPATDPSAPPK